MPVDEFGVTTLYASKTGDNIPKPWFMKGDWWDGPRMRLDENVSGDGEQGYKLDDNSMVRMTVSADDKDVDIECDNDFTESTNKGFVYKSNDWMGAANSGVEMTLFCKCSNVEQSDPTVKGNPIIWKGPTGEHHSNTDCCSGSSHMVHVGGEDEDLDNRIAMRLSKEMWHVNYHTLSDYKIIDGETWAITDNKWFGVKYIIWKAEEGGKDVVKIEVYLSPNGSKTEWKKVITKTDSGGWGSGGDDCGGKNDDSLAFGNARMMWRWDHRDGNDLRFKWGSLRAIDPNKGFEQEEPDPTNPPTNVPTVTSFKSTLKLQWNVNAKEDTCGIVGGSQIFYSMTDMSEVNSIVNDAISGNRTRVGQKASTSASPLRTHVIHEARWALQKQGSPAASPTISCKIYNAAGSVIYTSPTSIDPSTLPADFDGTNWTVFDFSTNTYTMQTGDRVVVGYTGTDDENYVHIWYQDPTTESGNTRYTKYDGVWSDLVGRDCVCQFLE